MRLAPTSNPAAYVHNPHTWSDPLGLFAGLPGPRVPHDAYGSENFFDRRILHMLKFQGAAIVDYRYRFMRGGFGLAANISAHTEERESVPSNAVQINQGLHLRLPVDHIYWKDVAWISFGLSLHSADLSRNDGNHLLVAVDSFAYPGADYQAEVAALAIDGWVHQNLNIPPCGISVSYEQPRRRFRFDWGPDVVPFCDALPG